MCLDNFDIEDRDRKILFLFKNGNYKGDEFDFEGNTLAHYTAQNGDISLFSKFLSNYKEKMDLNVLNNELESPLSIAVTNKNKKLVFYLIEQGSKLDLPENRELDGLSPIFIALNNDDFSLVEFFIDKIRKNLNEYQYLLDSISHLAVIKGNMDIIQLIFKYGADINYQNESGDTCLHIAYELNLDQMIPFFITKLLANVNIKNNNGLLPNQLKPQQNYDKPEVISNSCTSSNEKKLKNDLEYSSPETQEQIQKIIIKDKNFYEKQLARKISVLIRLYSEHIIDHINLQKQYEQLRVSFRKHGVICESNSFLKLLEEHEISIIKTVTPLNRSRKIIVSKNNNSSSLLVDQFTLCDYSSLDTLPTEVIIQITGLLDFKDCLSLSVVNRRFYRIINDPQTWKNNCLSLWPKELSFFPNYNFDWKLEYIKLYYLEIWTEIIQKAAHFTRSEGWI